MLEHRIPYQPVTSCSSTKHIQEEQENQVKSKGWERIWDFLAQGIAIVETIAMGKDKRKSGDENLHVFLTVQENVSQV